MLQVTNNTPFAADRTLTSDRNGAMLWVVVVKATFSINSNGSTQVAESQAEVSVKPKYNGKPGESSLLYDLDLIPTKPTTDVVLNGHAYAPKERPATQVDVAMRVGEITKTARVFGDRVWERGFAGMRLSDPEPFVSMPVVYERAFGGGDSPESDVKNPQWDRRNPVGTGFAKNPDALVGQKAPNIEDPNSPISSRHSKSNPIGFGPIACHWIPRAEFAGTYDEQWEQHRAPLLPRDFDERFYQSTPPDQQTRQYLQGGEPVDLMNLSPTGLMRFTLPKIWFSCLTRFTTGETVDHHADLHTVIIEPDVPRVILVWHTSVPCHGKDTKIVETTVAQTELRTR